MKIELGPTLTLALQKGRAAFAGIRIQRFWVQLLALTILALFTLAIVGRSAYARANALNSEAQKLALSQEGLDRWAGTMVWPEPDETALWRESESFFNRLGATSIEPLSLANQLASRGEEVSGGNVGIRLVSPDTAFIPAEDRVGSWVMRSGRSALLVDMPGDWGSVISFLGALPPQVTVSGMRFTRSETDARMTVLLLSREITQEQP